MGHNNLKSLGLGIAAGATAIGGIIAGRKALSIARISQGHPFKHRMLDVSSNLLQPKYPLEAMSTYLNGFHFYADDMGRQVEATHFCIQLRHGRHQCVIFDSNRPDARLIGIEYLINEEPFRTLPEEEQQLWHSDHYAVKSGMLVAPAVQALADHATYGDQRHDLHQCVIFDSNRPDARLIGIEYIINEERFRTLDEEEQQLWHSHHYEVKSGMLVAPGVPELAEHAYFEDLVTTYGKTFHTWQYDREDFPYGIPQLMMGFTADGQADTQLVQDRDEELGISTPEKRHNRTDIPTPLVQPRANGWEDGQTVQTSLRNLDVSF